MKPETEAEAAERAALEYRTNKLARALREALPAEEGFVLVTFNYGRQGHLVYAGTAGRGDTIRMLEELLTVLRQAGEAT